MPFMLPTWVACSITGPEVRRESSIAVGGTFDIGFFGGLPTEGDYILETKVYAGPTASWDETTFPPFPAVDSYTLAFTVTTEVSPPKCTVEGETKCVGKDQYICTSGKWKLKEKNSTACSYTPSPPPDKATLYGVVRDIATGVPIAEVTVYVGTYETTTDSEGYYELTDIEPGTYGCGWRKLDYYAVLRTLSFSATEEKQYDVVMEKIPVPTGVEITKITPDPCWIGGTISIIGKNFSPTKTNNWIHLVKALVTWPELTTMADSATTTKLTLDLSKSVGPPTYKTVGEHMGFGRCMVQVIVSKAGVPTYSNIVGFQIGA